jgi:hypothetical protein
MDAFLNDALREVSLPPPALADKDGEDPKKG